MKLEIARETKPMNLEPLPTYSEAHRSRRWWCHQSMGSSRGSVEGGPARSILRRRESLQLSERGRVDQQGGSGPNLAMAPTDMSRAGMDEGPNRHGYKRLQPAKTDNY